MRKLSLFAWTAIAVQIFFVYFMFQIGSSLGDCEEYVTDDDLAGVAGETACEVIDEAMTLLFLYGLGALWVFANIILGIVALARRKKRANDSLS